jgi:hypothetical protein
MNYFVIAISITVYLLLASYLYYQYTLQVKTQQAAINQ